MPASAAVNSNNNLHPCVRVYPSGTCHFGESCKYRNYPSNCCFSFLKTGVCNNSKTSHGRKCPFKHIAYTGPNTTATTSLSSGPQVIVPKENTVKRVVITKHNNDDDDCVSEAESRVSNSVLFPTFETPTAAVVEEKNMNVPNSSLASAPAGASTSHVDVAEIESKLVTIRSNKNNSFAVETKDSFTSIDEEVNVKTEETARCTTGLSYRLHTMNCRVAAMNAKVDAATAEMESCQRKMTAMENEKNSVIANFKRDYAARFQAEAHKNVILEDKIRAVDRAASEETKVAREFCALLKKTMKETFASLVEDAKANVADGNKKIVSGKTDPADAHAVFMFGAFTKSLNTKFDNLAVTLDREEERLRRSNVYHKVCELARAEFFKHAVVDPNMIGTFKPNECILKAYSPIAEKFFKAVPREEPFLNGAGTALTENFKILFHGTPSLEGAHGIECAGLDPNRRSGQAYGPGEYCSARLEVCHSYARNDGVILALLVYVKKGAPVTFHSDGICDGHVVVVNNPKDFNSTFMLPLGICYKVGAKIPAKDCKCSKK